MKMFCYQCQETVNNSGCTMRGVCGKDAETANLQDLLIYILSGIALRAEKCGEKFDRPLGRFVYRALFATITNVNFSSERITSLITEGISLRDGIGEASCEGFTEEAAVWKGETAEELNEKASGVGILSLSDNEDVRSLKSFLLYGIKGIAAYSEHAAHLGYYSRDVLDFMREGLAALRKDLPAEELTELLLEAGSAAATAMELLDRANTETYGDPEPVQVPLKPRSNPGILVSGHDLRDLEEILKQSRGRGIDVYTHGEMLPANAYPELRKYTHLAGNYGSSWWRQGAEFESFRGPVVLTTNCLIPVKDSYRERIFTANEVGYPGIEHIPSNESGAKDFSRVIEMAAESEPPVPLEEGELTCGFARKRLEESAGDIIAAVKAGDISRMIVMAGCDGRHPSREYYSRVAEKLPSDTLILTAGCAKYRYNKLGLGEAGGIPRVIDAGQCNDSYSLGVTALKLKEALGLEDVNGLPLSLDIAWYEQKAVAVLLALIHLGFRNIRLGPTLPGFLSPGVGKAFSERFGIRLISDPDEDVSGMMEGK